MNVLKAAKETMELWERQDESIESRDFLGDILEKELSRDHCRVMLTRMMSENFSYGKLCRWLGWIQAACVANDAATLEEMKEINKRNRDNERTHPTNSSKTT